MREVINGIHYVPRSGCAWHLMPHDLPHWQTAYHSFRAWRQGGTWLLLHDQLRQEVRTRMGRHPQPSAASIDAQTVKTTEHVLQPVERKNGAVGVRLQQAAETYSCALLAAFPLNGLRSRVLPQYGEWLTDALSALRAPFFKG